MSALANKITIHHTAGKYTPNAIERNCYHYLIDANGKITKGVYTLADNIDCKDGKYARHCGGGNTKNIGIAFCANLGLSEKTLKTNYPLTRPQLEAGFKLAAELSIKYGIPISADKIFTHYEFDRRKREPEGKIDIIYLPPFPFVRRDEVGNFIRSKIKWYANHFTGAYHLI